MGGFRSMTFAGLMGLAILGGCSSSDSDDWFGRDNDRDDDAITARDVEKSPSAARKLPEDARVVDEGRDTTLRYDVRDAGVVHLMDDSANMVVWSRKVRDGDRLTIDADKNRIEVNGREEGDIDLKSDHRFKLYFERR